MGKHTPIPGYPGYAASPDGQIWSIASNWRGTKERQLAPVLNGRDYLKIRMMVDGVRKNIPVHRLICMTFHGFKPTPAHEVCHINGDRHDNRAENLRWDTRTGNAADRDRHGRTSRRESHGDAIRAGLRAQENEVLRDAVERSFRVPLTDANARLIAAAPELLEALAALLSAGPMDNAGEYAKAVKLARAAIAKAEGR